MNGHARIMRVVEGACYNAAAAHPKWGFDPRLARSIAKRASGTLREIDPDALAMPEGTSGQVVSSYAMKQPLGNVSVSLPKKGAGDFQFARAPWIEYIRLLGRMREAAEREGNTERAKACNDMLGIFDATLNRVHPPTLPASSREGAA